MKIICHMIEKDVHILMWIILAAAILYAMDATNAEMHNTIAKIAVLTA